MPKKNEFIEKLAYRWIIHAHAEQGSADYEREFVVWEIVNSMSHGFPEETWEFIQTVIDIDSKRETLGPLATGPLEDLIANFGEKMIDSIVARAQVDRRVSETLGLVWLYKVSDEVRNKVLAVRNVDGWGTEVWYPHKKNERA